MGYETEGQLTGHLRRYPYSVVLLDEIEKAHPDVQHLFLQLFDTGRLTDSQGRLADGRNAIFIMTTNLGAKEALGFADMVKSYQEKLLAAIHQHFTMEFINRVDQIAFFNPLDEATLLKIFDLEFEAFRQKLQDERGVEVALAPEIKRRMVQGIAQQKLGARPLRRFIEDKIIAPVVDKLLSEDYRPGARITIGSELDIGLAPSEPVQTPGGQSPLLPNPGKFDFDAAGQAPPPPSTPKRPATPEEGLPHLDNVADEHQAVFDARYLALARRLADQDIALEIDRLAKYFLCAPNAADQKPREGHSIEQAFDDLINQPLTDRLVDEEFKAGDWIKLDYSPDGPVIKKIGGQE